MRNKLVTNSRGGRVVKKRRIKIKRKGGDLKDFFSNLYYKLFPTFNKQGISSEQAAQRPWVPEKPYDPFEEASDENVNPEDFEMNYNTKQEFLKQDIAKKQAQELKKVAREINEGKHQDINKETQFNLLQSQRPSAIARGLATVKNWLGFGLKKRRKKTIRKCGAKIKKSHKQLKKLAIKYVRKRFKKGGDLSSAIAGIKDIFNGLPSLSTISDILKVPINSISNYFNKKPKEDKYDLSTTLLTNNESNTFDNNDLWNTLYKKNKY